MLADSLFLGNGARASEFRFGSIRVRRVKEDRSFAVPGRGVPARWSAGPRIADTHGGTGCRAVCLFDGADPAYALWLRPAPHAALLPPASPRKLEAKGQSLLLATALDGQ